MMSNLSTLEESQEELQNDVSDVRLMDVDGKERQRCLDVRLQRLVADLLADADAGDGDRRHQVGEDRQRLRHARLHCNVTTYAYSTEDCGQSV